MLVAGAFFIIQICGVSSFGQVMFYSSLPAFLVWLCFLGIVLNRHEQSVVAARAWKFEAERIKAEWRNWSRRQIAVVGNVIFTPEENGMQALLNELHEVPAFPKKARPLFNAANNFSALMKEIDIKLELQHPGYRYFLNTIYILQPYCRVDEYRNESIFQQWDIIPIDTRSPEIFASFFNAKISEGLILILCLQDWNSRNIGQSSEFIFAQLLASPSFVRQHSLPVIAGITRMMPLEAGRLNDDLDMLFEYIQPDKQNLQYVWLSGAAEETSAEIMQYAISHQWLLPEKRPLHSIDLSFGPPGEMALPLSLAMLAEAANITGKDQLLVNQASQQQETLCLIARKLYA